MLRGWQELNPCRPSQSRVTGHRFRLSPTTLRGLQRTHTNMYPQRTRSHLHVHARGQRLLPPTRLPLGSRGRNQVRAAQVKKSLSCEFCGILERFQDSNFFWTDFTFQNSGVPNSNLEFHPEFQHFQLFFIGGRSRITIGATEK